MAEAKKTATKAKAPVKTVAPKVESKKEVAKVPTKVEAPKPVAKEIKAVAIQVEAGSDRNMRKTRIGKVVSNKMDKTIVVLITEKRPHPLYKKTVTRSKKFKAHDENNECGIGDTVEIMETRKLSKDKYFRLLKVIEKAK